MNPLALTEEDAEGNRFKEITEVANNGEAFATYEKALEFLELQRSSKYRIVGTDPFVSPVPLEKLEHYKLEYKSPTTVITRGEETISRVEIFEYFP